MCGAKTEKQVGGHVPCAEEAWEREGTYMEAAGGGEQAEDAGMEQIEDGRQERSRKILDFKQKVDRMLAAKEYDKIKPLLLSDKDVTEHDNDLSMVCYLCTILSLIPI